MMKQYYPYIYIYIYIYMKVASNNPHPTIYNTENKPNKSLYCRSSQTLRHVSANVSKSWKFERWRGGMGGDGIQGLIIKSERSLVHTCTYARTHIHIETHTTNKKIFIIIKILINSQSDFSKKFHHRIEFFFFQEAVKLMVRIVWRISRHMHFYKCGFGRWFQCVIYYRIYCNISQRIIIKYHRYWNNWWNIRSESSES